MTYGLILVFEELRSILVDDDEIARLVTALQDVWQTLGLGSRAAAE